MLSDSPALFHGLGAVGQLFLAPEHKRALCQQKGACVKESARTDPARSDRIEFTLVVRSPQTTCLTTYMIHGRSNVNTVDEFLNSFKLEGCPIEPGSSASTTVNTASRRSICP